MWGGTCTKAVEYYIMSDRPIPPPQKKKKQNKTPTTKKKTTKTHTHTHTHTQTPLMVWCRTGGGESIMSRCTPARERRHKFVVAREVVAI